MNNLKVTSTIRKGINKRGVLGLHNKRAETSDILTPTIIFIILNLMFVSILIFFIYNSSNGTLVYEQTYANQIGMFIDSAKPYSVIEIPFKEGIEVAEKNKINSKENLVSIKDNRVLVKLSSSKGYSFKYFSDYNVKSYFNGDSLVITVSEKTF